VTELIGFSVLFVALLILAAVLWETGAPPVEDERPHLRIRHELQGGRLDAIEVREAA